MSIKPRTAAEAFAFINIAALAGDVWVAHSVNAFERRAEWIPIAFSTIAPLVLLVAYAITRRMPRAARVLGFVVGVAALVVGVGGMLYHLQSHFFQEETIRSLVYTAPFAAPLAYAGLGLLLILDRMVDDATTEWAQWIVFLALGGFAGNFVLSLADHAQNAFFNRIEWVAVFSAAVGVGFLLMVVIRPADSRLLTATAWLMAIELVVGVAGFVLHLHADYHGPARSVWDRFLYGAPLFAPLLFPNLAILAAIGMWPLLRPAPSRD